eukprot:g34916.t1
MGERGRFLNAVTSDLSPFRLPRIVPSSSRAFALQNLAPGAEYDLCVLAIYGDTETQLAATRVLGCTRFGTKEEEYPHCRLLRAHFLGGTLSVAVGGAVMVALLVFGVAALLKLRGCGGRRLPKVSDVYSQTNGAAPRLADPGVQERAKAPRRKPKPRARVRGHQMESATTPRPPAPLPKASRSCSFDLGTSSSTARRGYAKRLSVVWTRRSRSVHGTLLRYAETGVTVGRGEEGIFGGSQELEESIFSLGYLVGMGELGLRACFRAVGLYEPRYRLGTSVNPLGVINAMGG